MRCPQQSPQPSLTRGGARPRALPPPHDRGGHTELARSRASAARAPTAPPPARRALPPFQATPRNATAMTAATISTTHCRPAGPCEVSARARARPRKHASRARTEAGPRLLRWRRRKLWVRRAGSGADPLRRDPPTSAVIAGPLRVWCPHAGRVRSLGGLRRDHNGEPYSPAPTATARAGARAGRARATASLSAPPRFPPPGSGFHRGRRKAGERSQHSPPLRGHRPRAHSFSRRLLFSVAPAACPLTNSNPMPTPNHRLAPPRGRVMTCLSAQDARCRRPPAACASRALAPAPSGRTERRAVRLLAAASGRPRLW